MLMAAFRKHKHKGDEKITEDLQSQHNIKADNHLENNGCRESNFTRKIVYTVETYW